MGALTDKTGLAPLTNMSAMQGPEQITQVGDELAELIDAAVETPADLPADGNWPGREMYTRTPRRVYRWDGSWRVVAGTVDAGAVTAGGVPDTSIGAGTRLVKDFTGWVTGYISLSRDPIPTDANLARVDAGFRPADDFVGPAAALSGGVAGTCVARVRTDGYIRTITSAGANTSLRFPVAYQAAS